MARTLAHEVKNLAVPQASLVLSLVYFVFVVFWLSAEGSAPK